jgi:MEDS: MEthanogen/methylotroph, DcmR Sensory domain
MPVFECSRCNNLTYSASRFALLVCDVCGSNRQRILEHAFSFAEAREEPRELGPGDHCCLTYGTTDEAVPHCLRFIRDGIAAGARVFSHVPDALEPAIRESLRPDEDELVDWGPAEEIYGLDFDPDGVVARFVAAAETEPRTVYVLGGPARPLETIVSADGYRRYERLATEATTATGMVVLCLLDRSRHATEHLSGCDETHPLAVAGDGIRRNERFVYA